MRVLKFGGSSVANAANIRKVINIVRKAAAQGPCAVVVSALQGTTDDLIRAGQCAERGDDGYIELISNIAERHYLVIRELFGEDSLPVVQDLVETAVEELERLCEGIRLVHELSPRTLDRVLSFGEIVSSRILSERLADEKIENIWADSRELIKTDSTFGNATVDRKRTEHLIREHFAELGGTLRVMPGFIASDAGGSTTTLGRGGSDYTAAMVAAATNARILEIWTDVSGMMTADPRFVKNVHEISHLTYREAMELSHFGAKVIYPPTIQPVMAKGIPIAVKNTFAPDEHGTLIESESSAATEMIRGISSIDRVAVLSLEGSGMVGIPGFSRRLFDTLWRANINVILITQSSSEHSICVAVEDKFTEVARAAVDTEFAYEISIGKLDPLRADIGFSILALVGDRMKEHTGVSGRMFTTLGQNGINIHAIAQGSSERNISAIISSKDVRKAVNTLHEEFFSDGNKQVNVFIAGAGTVGSRLIDQMGRQHQHLIDELRLNVRVLGIANSRRSLFSDDALDLSTAVRDLADGQPMTIDEFTDAMIEANKRNAVFVDVTASADVVAAYPKLLKKSISIIACNKIAASSEYARYAELRALAREYGANFFFETNVGAGLPVINTLGDLMRSGDRIDRIEAVLSGTLNFVFNHYDGTRSFAEVVRQAQDEGYTEPDPRLDLSGTDVARKILILARESGYELEMEDIENSSFLPGSCLEGSVDDFYRELERHEAHFRGLFDAAGERGERLKYIAAFDGGKASVGLQSIGPKHNFANLSGKDNAVLFYTKRYADQPLVIKGAGAGADVTAAGVFADIIRASR
ncbi:MAG: bifunctional aspartate kinase/homoserine dehydrogenase I [Acidobacteria bacterium]|nr:bifunctional aspartate kinase/homoserine dehydrogenase I [Acidobacteriota bacterium]